MLDFKFKLGEIVQIDPTGSGHGPAGKITGLVEQLDGSCAYIVTVLDYAKMGVIRHHLSSCDIRRSDT